MKIYLAGPINGCTDEEAIAWRQFVTSKLGGHHQLLDPMDRDYRGVEEMNVEEIVQGDLNDIEECDAVLANIIKPSAGTAMEVMHAFRKGKLVVVVGERLSPWLIYHSTHQFSNIVDAITYLRNT